MPASPKPKRPAAPKPTIGWREWVALPTLGITAVKAKIDTGARTSALHAFDLEEYSRDGVAFVRFGVHPEQRKSRPAIEVELPLLGHRRIRDSGGKTELRPVVESVIRLHDRSWTIELSLTRRDAMGFRMLLGRRAIRHRFLINPGKSYCAGPRPTPPSPPQPSDPS